MTEPESEITAVIDLSARRELVSARSKIAELEGRLAEATAIIVPAIDRGNATKHSTVNCRWHLAVTVDEVARKVECRWCGEVLDAVDVLLQFAHKERQFAYSVNTLREEQILMRKEVDVLRRERSRLRSDIKALKAKVP